MQSTILLAVLTLLSGSLDQGEQLREAARLGETERVRELLKAGVDVDTKNQFDVTPLYLAANNNHAETCRVLIEAGADINVQDNAYGFPLVQMAAWKGSADATMVLIEAGATGAIGAMFAAASNGKVEVIRAGLDADAIPAPVLPQLMATANNTGQTAIVDLLVERGVARPKPPEAPTFIDLPAEQLQRFVGSYTSTTEEADTYVAFVRDNQLHFGRTQETATALRPIDPLSFVNPETPTRSIVFRTNEGGVITGFDAVRGTARTKHTRTSENWQSETVAAIPDKALPITKPQAWPGFRGVRGNGIADGQHPPLRWNLENEANVRWKVELPGFGHSSPVVWGDRLFLTTAVGNDNANSKQGELGWIDPVPEKQVHKFNLLCYDTKSGDLLWQQTAHEGVPQRGRHWKASQANCTVTTDGNVVIAFFGSEGLHAYDLSGKRLWHKDLGVLDAGWYIDASFPWGFASSPILYDGKVYVQCDVHGQSFVAAFDAQTGKQLWRNDRDEIPSWCTPTIFGSGQDAQLVVNATGAIRGYCPQTGRELWQLRGNSHITVASPVCTGDMILATGGYQPVKPIYMIRPDARGDITPDEKQSASLHWHHQTGGAYQPTPLIYRGLAYLLSDNGIVTCYRAATGEKVYRKRVGGNYTASPIVADGRIYVTSEDGDIRVFAAGETFRILAENSIDDVCLATPAISNGALYVRSERFLMAIAHK